MARRQKQDSSEEKAAVRTDDVTVPKNHRVVAVRASELRAGMKIVTTYKRGTNRTQALKSQLIKELDRNVRGCGNIHVNGQACYDRIALVDIVETL